VVIAIPLLTFAGMSRMRPKRLLADKAYDANSLRRWLKVRRIRAVIPSTATRTKPFSLDRKAYKRRNQIERFFARLKNWRRIATRLMIAWPAITLRPSRLYLQSSQGTE
jgi:transposase